MCRIVDLPIHKSLVRTNVRFNTQHGTKPKDHDMTGANSAQADFWASDAGYQWIAREATLDAMMAGVLMRVLHHADLQIGAHVLDIGCGTGASCLAAAALVGPTGHVTGVDISAQLLDRARIRATEAGMTNTTFHLADAQTHAFAPASADAIISRFGVMFFEAPTAAFANMASALKPGGRMIFAAWAPAAQIPLFSIPVAAAIARLGKPAPLDPNAPGPMAFQNPERVLQIMDAAGLKNTRCLSETVALTPLGTEAEVAAFTTRVGPASRIMAEFSASEADTAAIEAEVGARFAPYETAQGMRIPCCVHFYCVGT
jgi:SAM-dependent methyltransferase